MGVPTMSDVTRILLQIESGIPFIVKGQTTMSERSIFLAALDFTDLSQRSNYLDQACGSNGWTLRVALLARVFPGVDSS